MLTIPNLMPTEEAFGHTLVLKPHGPNQSPLQPSQYHLSLLTVLGCKLNPSKRQPLVCAGLSRLEPLTMI